MGVARLTPDGALDPGFDPGLGLNNCESTSVLRDFVNEVAIQTDGNSLLAGAFLTIQGASHPYLGRLLGGEPIGPPSIVVPPQGQIAMAEQALRLVVVAAGNPPPEYQWRWNGNLIPGATLSTLTVTNITLG